MLKVPCNATLDIVEACAIVWLWKLQTHIWIWDETSGFARYIHPDFLLICNFVNTKIWGVVAVKGIVAHLKQWHYAQGSCPSWQGQAPSAPPLIALLGAAKTKPASALLPGQACGFVLS